MDDYFLRRVRRSVGPNLASWRGRFKGVKRTTKLNIFFIFVLLLCMGLFFYAFFKNTVRAQQLEFKAELSPEVVDPIHRVKAISEAKEDNSPKACTDIEEAEAVMHQGSKAGPDKDKLDEDAIRKMVKGYPIEKMAPFISKKDKKTAAFLVAIAKKESGWGEHAPRRGGKDCYNYWGYKGSYHLVGGYSCFDSPEQAVDAVGDRIGQLVEKGKDTPEKFLVWKCGSSCASHDPQGVRSWVGTVKEYWQKLLS